MSVWGRSRPGPIVLMCFSISTWVDALGAQYMGPLPANTTMVLQPAIESSDMALINNLVAQLSAQKCIYILSEYGKNPCS